jgi:hypothetical protein
VEVIFPILDISSLLPSVEQVPNNNDNNLIKIIIDLFACLFSSPKANYKVGTSKRKGRNKHTGGNQDKIIEKIIII